MAGEEKANLLTFVYYSVNLVTVYLVRLIF